MDKHQNLLTGAWKKEHRWGQRFQNLRDKSVIFSIIKKKKKKKNKKTYLHGCLTGFFAQMSLA